MTLDRVSLTEMHDRRSRSDCTYEQSHLALHSLKKKKPSVANGKIRHKRTTSGTPSIELKKRKSELQSSYNYKGCSKNNVTCSALRGKRVQ